MLQTAVFAVTPEPRCCTFDLFGELHPVGVGEGTRLLVDVVNVQNLTHELNDRLGFVEGCG